MALIKIVQKITAVTIFVTVFVPITVFARENVNYWYIKDFQSEIIANHDSSLNITEKITADCGIAVDKHGIFRTVPTRVYLESNTSMDTPVKLTGITDFNDNSINYNESVDKNSHSVSWQIGDPDRTVQGVNYYKISYMVKNAVRFGNPDFDELYWNLNGNFWDIETDNFNAKIILPNEINKKNSQINLYSGDYSQKNIGLASYSWIDDHTIDVKSQKTLASGEGITISVTFPKGIFTPYKPSFWEKYSNLFWLLVPFMVLVFSLLLWNKFGRDPKINPTIAPEFDIPNKLTPLEMGMVTTDGSLNTGQITAEIVNLAVNKLLKIEKIEKSGIFSSEDYKLTLLKKSQTGLTSGQKRLISSLFNSQSQIKLSDLKNKFYQEIPEISAVIENTLIKEKLIITRSKIMQGVFLTAAGIIFFIMFFTIGASGWLTASWILTIVILVIFSFLIKQRTLEGAEMMRKIRGFELYMKTAEKYRQRFFEQKNIFEKFLPYAILFGITGLWIAKMKEIYGAEYFAHYYPIWFVGVNWNNFNAGQIDSVISSMSSQMNSTMASTPSSSGSGGGGFSGGGGGGGGGGGW